MASELIQVMALIYRIQPSEVAQLEADLLERRKVAWSSALREQGRGYGCNKSPNAPRGRDLTELKAMSKEDAKSITTTWNRDVEKKLTSLYNANPKGNRNYYAKQMEIWATNRDKWKSLQIAMQTEQSTRHYAQERFLAENGLRGVGRIFVGPPAICKICLKHFSAGVVTQAYVDKNPAPVHMNCPHEWGVAIKAPMKCDETWLG